MKRREFIKSAAAYSGIMILPSVLSARIKGANERMRAAIIGCAGQGKESIRSLMNSKYADIVALCDVEKNYMNRSYKGDANKVFRDFLTPLPFYQDYRIMLDKMDKQIDGVCVCTPDHTHYPISAWAISKGKHVFCEKPLARTIWETRELNRLSAEAGVYTQMGNQVHTNDAWRTIREWCDAGIIGEVEDIYAWTDRNWGFDALPTPTPVPASLDYNLWLNVAQPQPFSKSFVPFSWRGLRNFGTGSAGDMGCHFLDNPYSAFNLGAPYKVVADALPAKDFSWPKAASIDMFFKNKYGKNGIIKLHWYDGLRRPKEIKGVDKAFLDDPKNKNCIFIVGSKHTMTFAYVGHGVKLTDRDAQIDLMKNNKIPPKKIPRNKYPFNPQADWADAIVHGRMPESNFQYAAPFTELILLSMIACVNPHVELEYDASTMSFPNYPSANKFTASMYAYRSEFLPKSV